MKPTTQRSASEANAPVAVPDHAVSPDGAGAPGAWQPALARRAVTFLVWGAPCAVTLAFGLYDIGKPMLWRDELATWSAASRSLSQLWGMVHHVDAVLAVYYFCLHFWIGIFGQSPTAMRIPSVFAMAGAAAMVGLIAKRFVGVSAGLAAGVIYALIPSVSRYAQEARPYAFASFFAVLATLLALRALERPRWHRWAIYALAVAAAGLANLVALCVVIGHATIVLAACLRRNWPAAQEPAAATRAPATARLVLSELRVAAGQAWQDRRSRKIVAQYCVAVVVALVIDSPIIKEGHDQSLYQLGAQAAPTFLDLTGLRGGLWSELFSSSYVAWAVLALAVISVITMPRRFMTWCALASSIVPIVFVWLFSQGPYSYWTYRYMLFTVPSWALSAGIGVAGLAELARRWPAWKRRGILAPRYVVAVLAVAVIAALGAHDQWAIRQPEAHNEWAYPLLPNNGIPIDYAWAASFVTAHELPGDQIVYQTNDGNSYEVDSGLAYYSHGKSLPPPVFQLKTAVQVNQLGPLECGPASASCLAKAGYPRLWVVYVDVPHVTSNFLDPFSAMVPFERAALRGAGYQVRHLYQGSGINVALLERG